MIKTPDQWAASVVKAFETTVIREYGPGWRKLSEEQRRAVIDREILGIVYGQDDPKYRPAVDLISRLQVAVRNSGVL